MRSTSIHEATDDHIRSIDWATSSIQADAWMRECRRARTGEATFLVAITGGVVVGKLSIDWIRRPDVAWIWMVSVSPQWQNRGIGTSLVAAAELRASGRSVVAAELAVDDDNPRAAALYERLGYVFVDAHSERRPIVDNDGRVYYVDIPGKVMRKKLGTLVSLSNDALWPPAPSLI
jgi:ribosomal protein S18 acetylase RimI-like enzyme